MGVWFVVRRKLLGQVNMMLQAIFMVCLGLYIGWSSFFVIGLPYGKLPRNAWAQPILLCPNDLHGLLLREAPDRWMATILSIALNDSRSMMPANIA